MQYIELKTEDLPEQISQYMEIGEEVVLQSAPFQANPKLIRYDVIGNMSGPIITLNVYFDILKEGHIAMNPGKIDFAVVQWLEKIGIIEKSSSVDHIKSGWNTYLVYKLKQEEK